MSRQGGTLIQLAFYRFARALVAVVFGAAFRMRVRGRQHIPRTGAFIVAPVHRSNLDIFFTGAVIDRRVRFMGKDSLWTHRWIAWLLTALGGFPVDRTGSPSVAAKAALKLLEHGEPVVVYPEGTRRTGPVVEHLHDGAAYLAIRTGVPILPVGLGNTERILARGKKLPRFLRVAVEIGPPITPPAPDGRRPKDQRAELTERIRVELQSLFDACQARVGAAQPRS